MALPLAVIGGAASALGGIAQGLIGGRARRREQRAAQAEFNQMKSRYMALDTSNPYANVTNAFEDLTVNTQAADFARQQSQQSSANILSGMAASAGGGGIAALAQSLANQQTQAAQAAAANIGQQEQRNQLLSAQGEMKAQQMRAQGEYLSQQMEAQKTGNLLQMAAGRKQQADQARQQATQSLIGGVTGLASMAVGGAFKGAKGAGGATGALSSTGQLPDLANSMPNVSETLNPFANVLTDPLQVSSLPQPSPLIKRQ